MEKQQRKNRTQQKEPAEQDRRMSASVLSFKEGLKVYEDITLIRIISQDYNLLILKDYMPVLGEIKGLVEIVSGEEQTAYEDISGFFMHSHNQFELLITEDGYVG